MCLGSITIVYSCFSKAYATVKKNKAEIDWKIGDLKR